MGIRFTRLIAATAATVIATTGLVACSSNSNSTSADGETTIRIGTTDAEKKAWEVFEQKAQENGIKLEVTSFGDYNTPNLALSQDQIDVNLFQHLKFLAEYNVANKDNLTPVGATEIVPLALFWKDHTGLDGIDGQEVAIPNDPSNQGRAINVLVQAKLVTLKDDTKNTVTPTPEDIDQDKSKVKVVPVDAAETTVAYGEGKPAIINNTYLDRAGIDPKFSVFADDPKSEVAEPYINAFVVKHDRKDEEVFKKLTELWHTQEVQDAVAEDSKGTSIPVTRSAEDLQKILERLEQSNK